MDNERQELQRILSTCLLGADISISKDQKTVSTDDLRAAINTYVCSDLSKQSKDMLAIKAGYTINGLLPGEIIKLIVRAAATQAREDSMLPYLFKKVIEPYLKEKDPDNDIFKELN